MKKKIELFLTIKRELFLLSVASLLLISLVISGICLKMLYNNSLADARASLRVCNSQIITFTQGLFRENAAVIKLLSQNDAVIYGWQQNEALFQILDEMLYNNENITYAYAGYADGSLQIRNYDTPAALDVTQRPWYQKAIATPGVAQLVYQDAATGTWRFSQSMRLKDPSGNVTGVVALDCSNEVLSRQLGCRYRYDSQRSFIVNSEGTVLIHPKEEYVNTSLRTYIGDATWEEVKGGSIYAEYPLNGVATLCYLERIPNTSFVVVTTIDAQEVLHPILKNSAMLLAIIVAVSLAIGVLLSQLYSIRFVRPIQALGGRIRNLAAGAPDLGQALGNSNVEIRSIVANIEGIVTDIANRAEKPETTEFLSFHDSMTGLFNRRFLEVELVRLDTNRNYPLCVLCCDVNGLKLVNDAFGHALGDQLLLAVADSLKRVMRLDDILARVEGDEFTVLLPGTTLIEAQQICQRIKSAMPVQSLCGAEFSVSLGYAVKEDAQQKIEDVVRTANEMMHEKKRRESGEMKRRTVENVIAAAQHEGLVVPLKAREVAVLEFFSTALCPESKHLLTQSYHLRKLGMCTLLASPDYSPISLNKRHTETSYRILSAMEEYRGVAACVLHYKEHWDGSGWPSGLAGRDIPLLSRIISVVEGYLELGYPHLKEKKGTRYDGQLVELLQDKQFE